MLVFTLSCASPINNNEMEEQYLEELRIQKNNEAKGIREKSISYAYLRSENISVSPSDLFGASSPIIVREKEIPAMETRINEFTLGIENFIKGLSESVRKVYSDILSRDILTDEYFHLLNGVNDAYSVYLLSKYGNELKRGIKNVVSEVKQTPLYNQYSSIYKTYNAWRINTNNLSRVTSSVQTFSPIAEGDIESVITSIIYDKWDKEIKFGEHIAKAEGGV